MRVTTINARFYVFPVPVMKEKKYLIFCSTQVEAEGVAKAIHEKKLVHPDLVSDDFLYLTYHTDGQTKIYVLNPKNQHLI